jgi:hypothetical protein
MAALENSNVNLTMNFDLNTLNRNISIGSTIYCKDNISNVYWQGLVISRTQLLCFISFNHHNISMLNLEAVLKVPSIQSEDVKLSTNFKPLFYLSNSFPFNILQKRAMSVFHWKIKQDLNTLRLICQ